MVAVPAAIPVNVPEAEPMTATEVLLLVHDPPGELLLSVADAATHTENAVFAVMALGNGSTVAVAVMIQPVASL